MPDVVRVLPESWKLAILSVTPEGIVNKPPTVKALPVVSVWPEVRDTVTFLSPEPDTSPPVVLLVPW